MATQEERMKILKMVEEGKLSPEEGAKLLAALTEEARTKTGAATFTDGNRRWLRVRVTDTSGRPKVNVTLPTSLVDVATKLANKFVPAEERSGMDFNEVWQAVRAGNTGKIIDVTDEEEGHRVEITID
jgi:hypothetical protein